MRHGLTSLRKSGANAKALFMFPPAAVGTSYPFKAAGSSSQRRRPKPEPSYCLPEAPSKETCPDGPGIAENPEGRAHDDLALA